jgi:hypothetical protein
MTADAVLPGDERKRAKRSESALMTAEDVRALVRGFCDDLTQMKAMYRTESKLMLAPDWKRGSDGNAEKRVSVVNHRCNERGGSAARLDGI